MNLYKMAVNFSRTFAATVRLLKASISHSSVGSQVRLNQICGFSHWGDTVGIAGYKNSNKLKYSNQKRIQVYSHKSSAKCISTTITCDFCSSKVISLIAK